MWVSDVLCLSAVTIRGLVHEWLDAKGLDVRPSYSWVRELLHVMHLSNKKLAKCVKELHSVEQRHANTHRLFLKLCWLMDKHTLEFQQKRFTTGSITGSSLGTGRDSVTKRSGVSLPGIERRVCSYPCTPLGDLCDELANLLVSDASRFVADKNCFSISSNFAISYNCSFFVSLTFLFHVFALSRLPCATHGTFRPSPSLLGAC